MPGYAIARRAPQALPVVLVAMFAGLAAAPAALATPGGGKSAATITASFGDSCRDFATHSSKDISHVEFHYLDGRVVKDESISSPDHAIDGAAGDEIEFAIVKSGTTSEQFDCVQSNGAPTALLEIKTPTCWPFWGGGLFCEQSMPRTVWTRKTDIPDDGGSQSGWLNWGCGSLSDYSGCSWTFSFRGTGSTDPDADIASWSLDFGDGTSVSGSWGTAPPTEVVHEYSNFLGEMRVVTLTVTDSAGQSDSETIVMVSIDQTPD
jgi:PKD domain-containing protein